MKKPKSVRQSRILTELNQAPSLRVAELARRLDVSTETIRRDLEKLEKEGFAKKTYGGAVKIENFNIDLPFHVRKQTIRRRYGPSPQESCLLQAC